MAPPTPRLPVITFMPHFHHFLAWVVCIHITMSCLIAHYSIYPLSVILLYTKSVQLYFATRGQPWTFQNMPSNGSAAFRFHLQSWRSTLCPSVHISQVCRYSHWLATSQGHFTLYAASESGPCWCPRTLWIPPINQLFTGDSSISPLLIGNCGSEYRKKSNSIIKMNGTSLHPHVCISDLPLISPRVWPNSSF